MMHMPVGSHVEVNAARFPAKVALIEGKRKVLYAELDRQTNRVASALRAAGIGRGDKVAICSQSRIEWVYAYVGIAKAGGVAVPINYRLDANEAASNIEDSESKIVFASQEHFERIAALNNSRRFVVFDASGDNGFEAFLETASTQAPLGIVVDPSDLQVILYTGGTTGRSKGVMLSHENVFWNSIHEIIDTEMNEDDNTILPTPLHHAAALNCWLLPNLYLGATITILRSFSPEAMLRHIADDRVTNGFTPPSMARDVYLHPLVGKLDVSSFKRWYVGAGALSRQDRDAMHSAFPGVQIYYQYGLSEAGVIVTVLKEKDYEKAPGSIGRAFLNFEVKILRLDLTEAAIGEVGEIAVRGPSVMKGYYKRPEETAAVFHNGWLRTGDMGSKDENGFIHFHDRLKDMVKTGGINVYCHEVEQALLKHSAIREVAVIGLPSAKWGEEVTAVVVLRDGATATEDELVAFGRGELAGFKAPKRAIILAYEELPISQSGKVLKRDLRARICANDYEVS